MQIDLSQIADESLLKQVWKKEVRPALRSMTLNNFNLASDPLHYAGYEWGITTLVSALSKDLRLGRYSPERGEIVRMAKSKGLSRPLCFLATRDALVYRTITWLIRGQLIAPMRWLTEAPRIRAECTGFGLNLVSGNYEFACLIVIEDEEFWPRFGGDIEANWESAGLRVYSTLDERLLANLAADESWSNEGLFAFLQGLRRLSDIDARRVNAPTITLPRLTASAR